MSPGIKLISLLCPDTRDLLIKTTYSERKQNDELETQMTKNHVVRII